MKVKVTCDSTCDLSNELLEKYDISVIPLYIIKGEASFRDGVDIDSGDVFEYMDSGKGVCHTAAVNVSDYIDFFRPLLSGCDAIVHINICSEFSSCHANALIAAEELGNIYPVDSRNLSSGSGHLAIDAAIMAEEGMSPEEIKKRLVGETEKVEASFILDTLNYLHMGGRCSTIATLGANILSLKPCIEVTGGKMTVGKKYRGNLEKVLLQYVKDRLAGREDIDQRRIFITTTGVPDSTLEKIEQTVRDNANFEEIIHNMAGCTIATHCGPRCLGILFLRK